MRAVDFECPFLRFRSCAAHTLQMAKGLNVIYWNFDCNKILNGGTQQRGSLEPVFPELSNEKRLFFFKTFMLKQLANEQPDVVGLSESYNYINMHDQPVDVIGKLTLFFQAQGYAVFTLPYFQNEPAGFNHLVAVKSGVELVGGALQPIWMTKNATPGKGERCVASAQLRKNGQNYVVNFCHMAMARDDRIKSAEVIGKQLHRVEPEVFVGDFNTFSDDGGSEQISKITDAASGLSDVPLVWPDGRLVDSTIAFFVYDPVVFGTGVPKDFTERVAKLPPAESRAERIEFYKQKSEVKGGVLDHIFLRNGKVRNAKAVVSSVAPNALTSLTDDEAIRAAGLKAAEENRVPFVSDHVMLSFSLFP